MTTAARARMAPTARPAARSRQAATAKSHEARQALAAAIDYLQIFKADPLERIRMVKAGLPAAQAKQILRDLALAQGASDRALDVATSTLNRKAKNAERLPRDESERFLGLAKLVGQVQALVEESGEAEGFDARAWTARWLSEPLPAFGGARPVDLMDTMEGQALVADALARIQSGAYG